MLPDETKNLVTPPPFRVWFKTIATKKLATMHVLQCLLYRICVRRIIGRAWWMCICVQFSARWVVDQSRVWLWSSSLQVVKTKKIDNIMVSRKPRNCWWGFHSPCMHPHGCRCYHFSTSLSCSMVALASAQKEKIVDHEALLFGVLGIWDKKTEMEHNIRMGLR